MRMFWYVCSDVDVDVLMQCAMCKREVDLGRLEVL